MKDYFKDDEYWKAHIDKQIEEDIWIDEYKTYFLSKGKCLDLGCGVGLVLMSYFEGIPEDGNYLNFELGTGKLKQFSFEKNKKSYLT